MAIVSNQVKDIVQQEMLTEIRTIMNEARSHLARQVNQPLLAAYWNIGRVIVEHEQNQNVRAEYGKEVLKQISRNLTKAFGKVFPGLTFKICDCFTWPTQNARQCLAF